MMKRFSPKANVDMIDVNPHTFFKKNKQPEYDVEFINNERQTSREGDSP